MVGGAQGERFRSRCRGPKRPRCSSTRLGFVDVGGAGIDGTALTALYFPDKTGAFGGQLAEQFVNDWKQKYNSAPNIYAAHAHDATNLIAEAAKKAGPDAKTIREQLSNVKGYAGVTGETTLSSSAPLGGRSHACSSRCSISSLCLLLSNRLRSMSSERFASPGEGAGQGQICKRLGIPYVHEMVYEEPHQERKKPAAILVATGPVTFGAYLGMPLLLAASARHS